MQRIQFTLVFILLLLAGIHQDVCGQEERRDVPRDSLLILQPGMDTTQVTSHVDSIYVEETMLDRPKTATYFSAALPGLGQVYNNSYWKLPIIYSGFITLGHFINWNHNKYQQYRNALFDQIKGYGTVTNPLAKVASEDALRRGVEYYRHNRDYLMIFTAGLYLLQIVEAHVDAHLIDFYISEDLTASIKPSISSYYPTYYSYGLSLVFELN